MSRKKGKGLGREAEEGLPAKIQRSTWAANLYHIHWWWAHSYIESEVGRRSSERDR